VGNGKIEKRQVFSQWFKVQSVLVLNLRGCYVPGLESIQTSILRQVWLIRLDSDRKKPANG